MVSINKFPNKRSHKRVVKKRCITLLPSDFLIHDRLVAAVKITKTTPIDLSTIVSVLIDVVGGVKTFANTNYLYIQKDYTKITKAVSYGRRVSNKIIGLFQKKRTL